PPNFIFNENGGSHPLLNRPRSTSPRRASRSPAVYNLTTSKLPTAETVQSRRRSTFLTTLFFLLLNLCQWRYKRSFLLRSPCPI
ncbi:hypothetical protein LINPERHAP2_LOCUS35059, partial [Linum perenne]